MVTKSPLPRARYHHGDVARELLRVSVDILSEVGSEGFTLREAARRVGVSHRAVYRHYEDKHALLATIAEGGYRELAADMVGAVSQLDSKRPGSTSPLDVACHDALIAIAEAYLRFARREPARFQVMFGPRLNAGARFTGLEEAIAVLDAVLEQELRIAGPRVSPRARRDAGVTLWAAIHGMSSLVLARRIALRDAYVKSYVATVMEPVVSGILAVLNPR